MKPSGCKARSDVGPPEGTRGSVGGPVGGNGSGRPREEFDLELVERLARKGYKPKHMAVVFDVCQRTFERRMAADPVLREAMGRGVASADMEVLDLQWETARNVGGNGAATMQIHLGKTRPGLGQNYSEHVTIDGGVSVEHAVREDALAEVRGFLAKLRGHIASRENPEHVESGSAEGATVSVGVLRKTEPAPTDG